MSQTLFLILATLGLLMALGTVLARNLIHAALYLVAFFFLIACMFVLLEAEFLAAMQVLVYIGAVAILLLFGIMLTRNIQGDESSGSRRIVVIPAAGVTIGLLAMLVYGIRHEPGTTQRPSWSAQTTRPPSFAASATEPLPPRALAINNMSRGIGDEMMTRFVVPFELAGLLLTVAVVGAVALAIRDRTEPADDDEPEATPATQPAQDEAILTTSATR